MNTVKPTVVRLSLRWVLAAIVIVLALGVLGGMVGVSIYGPQTPLQLPGSQLVTNVQEVTVSPNRVVSDVVDNSQRSVLQLAHGNRSNPTLLGSATVVTNDGVLVARHLSLQDDVFAIDATGKYLDLESIGRDDVYGVVFYRVRDGVLAPLELAAADPDIGASLLLLERSPQTNMPVVRTHQLEQYTLPQEDDPPAWQRVGTLTPSVLPKMGSPLLTEEGKVAALIADREELRTIPISYVRRSLERLAAGKREFNPFETYGFTTGPGFVSPNEQNAFVFALTITSVQRNIAPDLRVGDVLVAINDQRFSQDADIVALLSETPPLTLTVTRGGREQTITIPSASPSP